MAVPYIGVTGVLDSAFANVLAQAFPWDERRRLMAGVCCSKKMLREGRNRHPYLFPDLQQIPRILSGDPRVLNIIHYFAEDDLALENELAWLMSLCQSVPLHGFQLNIPWPRPEALQWVHRQCGRRQIILALDSVALAQEGNDPSRVVSRLQNYGDLIDYVLLDPSRGEGKELDPAWALPFLDAIAADRLGSTLGLVVAGGLGPNTVAPFVRIWERYPNVSCDAQGKLQDPENKLVRVDWACDYIYQALIACGIQPGRITG